MRAGAAGPATRNKMGKSVGACVHINRQLHSFHLTGMEAASPAAAKNTRQGRLYACSNGQLHNTLLR